MKKSDKGIFSKSNIHTTIMLLMVLCLSFGKTVYANSSWIWLTDTQPYELLPVAIILTLFIETILLTMVLKVNIKRIFRWVCIGNLSSFVFPYIMMYGVQHTQMGYNWIETFSSGPYYIIGMGYLLLTLVIEIPVIWSGVGKEIVNKRRGIGIIVIANTITTAIVFLMERIICQGKW